MSTAGIIVLALGALMVFGAIFNRRNEETGKGLRLVPRVFGFVFGLFVALVGLGLLLGPEDASVTTAETLTPSQTSAAEGASTARADYLEEGVSTQIGNWVIQGGGAGSSLSFTTRLGDEFFGETADSGYQFALVPVFVRNTSRSTDSLGWVTWKLRDDEGYEYSIQTMADIYLSENQRLDVSLVPPGAIRGGYLVFQVRQGISELYLTYQAFRGSATWRYLVN